MSGVKRLSPDLRVLLVGDTSEPARLLRLALSLPGLTVVQATLESAREALAAGRFDVCVLSCGRPEAVGSSTGALTRLRGCPPVVVVVQEARVPQLVEAVAAGAYGYVLETMPPEQLTRALVHAAEGRTVVPRSVIGSAAEQLRQDADPGLAGVSTAFTRRERQTLTMLRAGCDTRDIAERLGVTPATVRTYVSAIMRKLGVHERADVLPTA